MTKTQDTVEVYHSQPAPIKLVLEYALKLFFMLLDFGSNTTNKRDGNNNGARGRPHIQLCCKGVPPHSLLSVSPLRGGGGFLAICLSGISVRVLCAT